MNEEEKFIEELSSFARTVLDNKEIENRAKAAIPLPNDSGVRSSWHNQPYSSKTMEAPRGRNQAPKGGTTEVTEEVISYAAFYRVYVSNGRYWLQGGQVSGSSGGNVVIPDINLSSTSSTPANGMGLWMRVTGSGNLMNGILYPGFQVTGASTTSSSTAPTNSVPTAQSHTGKNYHVLLGMWQGNQFSPSTAGNIQIGFCGSYQITRF